MNTSPHASYPGAVPPFVPPHGSATRLQTIECDVRDGTRRDAVLYATGCNLPNGLRPCLADRKKAAQALLDDPEWAAWSDRKIGAQCGLSHHTVAAMRPVTGQTPSERLYVTKHDREAATRVASGRAGARRSHRKVTRQPPAG